MAKTKSQLALEKLNKKYGIQGTTSSNNSDKGKQGNTASPVRTNTTVKTKSQSALEKLNKKYGVNADEAERFSLEKAIGFDTINDDLTSTNTTLDSVYKSWQDKNTMSSSKASVEKMYNRLKAYDSYRKKYGNDSFTDISDTLNAYKGVLDDWENLSNYYELEGLKNELSEKKIKYTDEYWQAVHDEAVSRFRSEGQWDSVKIENRAWAAVDAQRRAWAKEKEEIEDNIRRLSGIRDATWKDATIGSFERGYHQSQFGDESYNKMVGYENEADALNELLKSEKYQFEPEGYLKEAVSGAAELIGQMGYSFTKPENVAKVGTATLAGAGTAAVVGQTGPQLALPEEIATVPAGALLGFRAGMGAVTAENALRIEAGHAYNEMIENGISHATAQKIALGVGTINAALEVAQVDELVDAFKVLNKSGATSTVAEKIFKELLDRGVDVAKEVAQEVGQEGVTMGGTELAHRIDTGERLYTPADVSERMGDTIKSSALAFGFMNVPATVTNLYNSAQTAKTVGEINKTAEAINTMVESEDEKIQPLPANATAKEINNTKRKIVSEIERVRQKQATAQLDAQLQKNEQIALEDVKTASGFGDNGAKLLTEIASKEGMTFFKAREEMKDAYLSGYTGNDVAFTDDLQNRAKLAGIDDRIADNNVALENAKNATVYDGAFTENEHTTKFTKAEKKMISTVAKSFRMNISAVDKIIASVTEVNGREIQHEANASHADGKMRISSTAQKVIYELVMHEGGHRMKQLAPTEFGVLMDALYERAERRRANRGISPSGSFDNIKTEHDYAGIRRDTGGYLEEFAVRELERIFGSAREFNKWYAEISGDQQLKTNFEKFIDWVLDVIDDIKRAFAQANMSKEERTKANAELDRIKELYTNAFKATERAATEIAKGVQEKQSKPVANETKSSHKETPTSNKIVPQAKIEGIKAGDVFVANETGTKYKVVSKDDKNTTVEITSDEGTKTMVVSNEIADRNFTNMSDKGVAEWIDEDMHIDNRTWEDVGSRKVKAFQFLFPEIKEYYTPLAHELLGDLKNTIKGERILTGTYETGQEWTGVNRLTSDAIARIKDATNATYDDIRNALNRLINDEGQENIALAKKIELVFDEMLTDGYNTFDGTPIPANEEYIAKKEELLGKTYEGNDTEGALSWLDDMNFSLKNKNLTINSRIPYVELKGYINVVGKDISALNNLEAEVRKLKRETYQNDATGYRARITGNTIGKAIKPTTNKNFSPFTKKHIRNLNAIRMLPELFKKAVYVDTKPPQKSKNQNKDIKGFHHFVAPLFMDNGEYRALITAREKTNSNTLYVLRVEVLPTQKRHTLLTAQQKAVGSQWLSVPSDISIAELVNNVKIKDYDTNIEDTYTSADIQFSLKEKINQSMTMEQAKDMIQRAFVIGEIKEWFDGEYQNGDEWLRGEGADAVAMVVENEWTLQQKFLNKIQGIIDDEFYVADIIEAYEKGTLTGKVKQNVVKRLDTSRSTNATDTRVFAPKDIKNAQELYKFASERVTNSNREKVQQARADIIMFAHTRGAAEALGLTQSELNKKLATWARYTARAREVSMRINNDLSLFNKWTGIENSNILNRATVSQSELDNLVNEVKGDSNGWQRNYIMRTMLALDTHIDYSELNFEFVGTPKTSMGKSVNGLYDNSHRKITVKYNAPHTVSHEMGHFLDYQWARDLGCSGALTDGFGRDKQTDADIKQFLTNFDEFIERIENVADLRSEYTMDRKEVFARFVAKFVQWVDLVANGKRSYAQEYLSYNDKFTASQYIEFVRLLQEKSMLDAKRMESTDISYSLKDSEGKALTAEQQEYFKDSKIRDKDGNLLVMYHGTKRGGFTVFDGGKDYWYFTNDKKYSYTFEGRKQNGHFYPSVKEDMEKGYATPQRYKVYLNVTNPYIADIDTVEEALYWDRSLAGLLREKGYDALMTEDMSQVIVLNANQIKNTTNKNPSVSDDIRHSLKGGMSDTELIELVDDMRKGKRKAANKLAKYAEGGAISTEEYTQLIEKYGAIASGEKPHREIQVPRKTEKNKKVSQTVRTILEAKATPDEVLPTIEKMVEDGIFSYDAYTDKQAIKDSEDILQEYGWVESYNDWMYDVEKGIVSKQHTVMGWALYNNAVNTATTTTSESERKTAMETALNVLDAMVRHQRNAAQALQATRVLKKLSPETQLYGVQKSVQALQKELTDKYGDKAPDLKINEELAEQFINAKTPEERAEIEKEIYKDIGRQMPSRFIDKWNAWRYLAMLGNLRTHGRNILGNAFFAPVVVTKNMTASAIESVVNRVSSKKMVRGKAIITGNKADRQLLKAAWGDYGNVADMISNGGKYNDSAIANQAIEDGRQIFKTKPLEWARKKNSALLEVEDMWFAQPHYAYALAQYCKANNITAEQIQRGKAIAPARAYAIKEAQKATYRDTNAFSQMVSSWGRSNKEENVVKKAFSTVIEGILPFRKTPANILVRGVEYSPIGLLKGLSYDLVQVSKGKMSATDAIDNVSAGLTGTGLLALGVYLAAQGLIRGHGEDDKDEKEFNELMGHQAYALELPNGQSITLDWLAPEALPFFVGVNIWESTKGSDEELNFSSILKSVSNITEPMLEMSCLQSLNDLFESVGYASSNDTSGLISVLSSAVTSYLTQGIPTLLGQAERTAEEERMTTYTEKNGFLTGDMQYTLGKASAKIPFWDYNQIPYIDAWGRKEASGTALKRGLNNFLNPAYTSTIESSKMEKELLRLYEKTGETGVFPSRADKYFQVDGKRKDLTAEQYVRYATLKGQKSYKLVSDLVKSSAYKKLSDEEKIKAIEEAYDYANQKAKKSISSSFKTDSWVSTADEFGSGVGNYLAFRADVSDTRTDNGGKISKQEVIDIALDMAKNDSEIWKMYLSEYDSKSDLYAYDKGVSGGTYMNFLDSLGDVDQPNKSGKYGTYTQDEAYNAIKRLKGLSQQEKAILWQSVNTTWKNNPFR